MDFRRSGAIEASAGKVDPAALADNMANTIDQNKELQANYLPHDTTLVRILTTPGSPPAADCGERIGSKLKRADRKS